MSDGLTLQGGVGTTSMPWLDLARKVGDKVLDVGSQIAVAAYNNHNAKRAAQRQYENTQNLMNMQYDLNRRAYDYQMTQGPTLYRQGLSSAGYNPILPFVGGSGLTNASFGSSGLGSAALENPAFIDGNVINQARMVSENIRNLKSQTSVNNANASLIAEKENTERIDQALKFNQSELNRIESELKQKDLDKYEERWLLEQRERLTNIATMLKNSYSQSAVAGATVQNAKVNSQSYKLAEEVQGIIRDKERRYKEWGDKYGWLRNIDETLARYFGGVSGNVGASVSHSTSVKK